jgi:periplasmic protein TonB
MRDRFFRPLTSVLSSSDSLIRRVMENFHQVLTPTRIFPSSANGAPLHLPRWGESAGSNKAHSASLLTHAAVITALVLAAVHPPGPNPKHPVPGERIPGVLRAPSDLLKRLRGLHPSGGTGNGSGHDPLPPTQGNLPARSSIQFLKPTLPHNPNPELPVPPTILDASAPRVVPPVINIGIPWMAERNNSSGPSNGNTIGTGPNDSIGTAPGNQAGIGGPPGPYQPGMTLPQCVYCPEPLYTDEARQAKLQGKVTLRVLVGADGRASQIQILQGAGLGLEERAVQSVRNWKFIPAHDAARHAVSTWVTIEVVFRLI